MKVNRAARSGKELIGFRTRLQIVVEVAEASRICRFGEKIRESKNDISLLLKKSSPYVLFVKDQTRIFLRWKI